MARFYADEADPPRPGHKPLRLVHYTPSEIEKAYIESMRYAQSLEEFIADHFKKQHRDVHEVHA